MDAILGFVETAVLRLYVGRLGLKVDGCQVRDRRQKI